MLAEKLLIARGNQSESQRKREEFLSSQPIHVAIAYGMLLQERLTDFEDAWHNGEMFPDDVTPDELSAVLGIPIANAARA